MNDPRFVKPDAKAIQKFRRNKLWSKKDLAEAADVSLDTIKRAEKGEPKQPVKMRHIATALGVQPIAISRDVSPESAAARNYTWDDIIAGARKVSEEICKNNIPLFDAVLTFPGPSSLFCGLVLAMLPRKIFIRMPVYTAIFADANTPTSVRKNHFDAITVRSSRARPFKLLIPRELTEYKGNNRIVVIDDTIITGGTMKKLRQFFAKKRDRGNLKFACCVCYAGQTLPTEEPPEIIGLPLEERQRFLMPWNCDSFCFEDALSTDQSGPVTNVE